jgi:hypothetical protein
MHAAAGCLAVFFCAQLAFAGSSDMEILLKKLEEKGIFTKSEADEIAKESKGAEWQKADGMEILLKKLEEKGIFTKSEADEIAKESKGAVEAQNEEVKEIAAKTAAEVVEQKEASAQKTELPAWIQNAQFHGDLRLRYEVQDKEDAAEGGQERARYRLRAGVDTTIADGLVAGFSLASGTGDLRTDNQTLTGTFDKKSVWIDTAYARYTPVTWFSIIGGKFVNPIWQPADMIMQEDITPEGTAMRLRGQATPNFGVFLDSGLFILSDTSYASPSTPDPLMMVFQPGFRWNFTDNNFFRFAPAYYNYSNLQRSPVLTPANTTLSSTNTAVGGKYKYNYSAIDWGGELGFKNPFGTPAIPYFGIMGGYLNNPSPSANNVAYLAGFTMGYTDVKQFGDWAVEYTYRRYEKDAILDVFPDSNFYNGNTDAMGHRIKFLFGLTKNTALGLNFYDAWKIRNFEPTSSLLIPEKTRTLIGQEYVGQADILIRF